MAGDPAAKRDPAEGRRYRHRSAKELLEELPVGAEPGEDWPEKRPKYYTRGAFEERAKHLGNTLPELHSRRRFVFFYSDDDLERLCADQPPLSRSAIRWLLRIKDREERERLERLERQAVKAGWTAVELKKRVGSPSQTRGRPPKRPKTFEAGVAMVIERSEQFTRSLEQLVLDQHSVFQPAKATSTAGRTKRKLLQQKTKTLIKVLQEYRELLTANR